LESDIQRESTIQRLSAAFGTSEKALLSDYQNRKQPRPVIHNQGKESPAKPESGNIRRNAELRAVLAVAVNQGLFPRMRARLSSDDFEDAVAKDLYIALEECFREGSTSYDSLLQHCSDEGLRALVSETAIRGEFSQNADKIVEDGIILVRRNVLEKKRARIVARMAMISGATADESRTISEMMAEKQGIDEELAKLKDTNE